MTLSPFFILKSNRSLLVTHPSPPTIFHQNLSTTLKKNNNITCVTEIITKTLTTRQALSRLHTVAEQLPTRYSISIIYRLWLTKKVLLLLPPPPQPPLVLLPLHCNGHLPGRPGLAGTRMSPFWTLLELRMTEVVSGDNWSYKSCKAPVKSSTSQHPIFYRPDALPVV